MYSSVFEGFIVAAIKLILQSIFVILLFFQGGRCLRNVSLEVVPEVVQRGHEAILRCLYDLEDRPLYSVKWYRGRRELYRYAPKESPATKTFPIAGIDIDVSNQQNYSVNMFKGY